MIPDGRSLASARGKSELHRARVPGESRGNACRCALTVQIGVVVQAAARATETMPRHAGGEKGNPPRSNLRLGRKQVARRGPRMRAGAKAPGPQRIEIDDRLEQNSAYGPVSSVHGASSSIGRALVCGTSGYGFEPREAPHTASLPRRDTSDRRNSDGASSI